RRTAMTRTKLFCLLAAGAVFALGSAAEASRPWYRCAPQSWFRSAQPAQTQSYYYQDAQGTYRRYSVEPGAAADPVVTPAPSGSWDAIPSTPTTTDRRSIQQRRQRPGQGFGPR